MFILRASRFLAEQYCLENNTVWKQCNLIVICACEKEIFFG